MSVSPPMGIGVGSLEREEKENQREHGDWGVWAFSDVLRLVHCEELRRLKRSEDVQIGEATN